MWNWREIFKKSFMCRIGKIPYDPNSCIPRSGQLRMFLRISLPQIGAIECSRVETEEFDDQTGFIVTKLLHYLVNLIIEHITKHNRPYGIIWSQNVHFVTTVPLTRTGVLYPRVQDFLVIFCFFVYITNTLDACQRTST